MANLKEDSSIEEGVWDNIRAQFELTDHQIHMSQLFLTSHPKKIQRAIESYRKKLDKNPVTYIKANHSSNNWNVAVAASKYLQCRAGEVALTDSTTMGLGILYSGLKLNPEDEVLTTNHCHYAHAESLAYATKKSGATLRKINLYESPAFANTDEILGNLKKGITSSTRLVALTYVHSSTGVKLPLKEIANEISHLNKIRDNSKRIYLCIDAVHALGVENFSIGELGCDFLVAGTHKWMFGPRGTGIIYGKKSAWDMIDPIIPPFSNAFDMWKEYIPKEPLDFYSKITPGGYHTFEYRWALKEAFEFHLEIGKERVQNRTHQLNSLLKHGLLAIPQIKLLTPNSQQLSSGITCFEVEGMSPNRVVKKLREANIIGTTTPYKQIYVRLTPSIINNDSEIMRCLEVLGKIHN